MFNYRRVVAQLTRSKLLSERKYFPIFRRLIFSNNNSDSSRFKFIPILFALGGSYLVSTQCLSEADAADDKKHHSFSRYMVADAVSLVSPCVVNILCPIEGLIASGMSSGSGFILSKVGGNV